MSNRPTPLRFGLAFSVLGALAVAAAPLLPVVRAGTGAVGSAILAAAIVAAITVSAIPVAAFAVARRSATAAGALLAGAGGIAAGAALADLTLFVDAIDANRFELFRPVTAAALTGGPGAAMLLAGHLCAVLAGVAGAIAAGGAPHADEGPVGTRPGTPVVAGIVGAATVVAVGLLAPVVVSSDPVIVARGVLDAPATTALGGVLTATFALVTVAWALSAGTTAAAGAIAGAGAAALALLAPRFAAGLAGDRLSPTPATAAGTIAAVLLVVLAAAMPAAGARRAARPARPGSTGVLRSGRAHAVAGVLGLLTAALAVVGALLPTLSVPAGHDVPDLPQTRVLLVAGLLLAALSVWLLLSACAETVRPAVAVPIVAVAATAAAVLQAWVVAADLPGVDAGPGTAVVFCTLVGAAATGVAVLVAGAAERDRIDTSAELHVTARTRVVVLVAAVACIVGSAVPLYHGAGSLLAYPWGYDVWGRALLAVAVGVAAAVAVRSRPARGGALLLGAAGATAVYASSWVLVRSVIQDPVAALCVAPVILGTVLLLVAASLTLREESP
ncbi:hypothetical protein I0Q12_23995 [Rhodococcus sp. CX]|uniref:hypothetical protein n=1 Tax=Rhodococcus sp. CX TaxID=2789880 RepID=UPI0018CD2107|nr:hypothetical protein [Rhodococcus sp. CX]MBH0122394.1 hypothetical protein [Rhodococcus sp. CX]